MTVTNSTGAIADSYSYTAYGKSVSASTNDANPFQFGGKFGYYSEYNGAVLCGHRWYDALITFRWLSRDPIGYKGGDNLYAYCGGDPVNECDEDGDKRHRHHRRHPKPVHHKKPKPSPEKEEAEPWYDGWESGAEVLGGLGFFAAILPPPFDAAAPPLLGIGAGMAVIGGTGHFLHYLSTLPCDGKPYYGPTGSDTWNQYHNGGEPLEP